jgi:hypothetical protein
MLINPDISGKTGIGDFCEFSDKMDMSDKSGGQIRTYHHIVDCDVRHSREWRDGRECRE